MSIVKQIHPISGNGNSRCLEPKSSDMRDNRAGMSRSLGSGMQEYDQVLGEVPGDLPIRTAEWQCGHQSVRQWAVLQVLRCWVLARGCPTR